MKVSTATVFDILSRMRVYFQGKSSIDRSNKSEPFRSELYNSNQMDIHAKVVARAHKMVTGKAPDKLLKRLGQNEKTLVEVRNLLVDSVREGQNITPGAEWLLDNFYLIEEQVVIARKHLPKGYSEGLPYLIDGDSVGFPRVYDIVLEIISHSDGRVDARSLISFIASYQTEKELTLGELWAIPIMLRLAVIENLRRVSEKIALDMIDNNLADFWAEQMMLTVQKEPENLVSTIADMARSKPVLGSAFVAGFTRKLQGKGPALALPLSWMEQQLSRMEVTSSDLVWQENQKQATDQVSVSNSISTLRFIGKSDWREFVETLSSVEQILRKDITGTYPLMTFSTRDRYRHVVEAIAKASSFSETEVARKVMEFVEAPIFSSKKLEKHEHVGYYLIDKGRRHLEIATKMRSTFAQRLTRFMEGMPVFIYLSSILLLTIIGAASMFSLAYLHGSFSWHILTLVAILSIAGAAQLAISITNWLATIWISPQPLPRMDFSKGIPTEYRTLVAVPSMLSNKSDIEDLVEALEVRFLANRDPNLHFALVTDYMDADSETMPEDEQLLELVSHRIRELNEKYSETQAANLFFLFHRSREWNPKEKKWMGHERKRGKLAALNALLRERTPSKFSTIVGKVNILTSVKYVITLDSDTQLPREAAWKFIATMAHPLNHAVYNPKKKRITEGYGILQPRVAVDLPKGATSLYLRMQGEITGIDPYTRASSDVYQDLFSEGSFIGKGIYDVDIFEKVVGDTFQDNRILSHDLIEGCYSRSGLISDVLLYEENPSQYKSDVNRHHRWIRGDWQIGAWIMPYVTNIEGKFTKNNLSVLSVWKIFDNLRRSLLPLSLLLILLLGWSVLPYPWFWTLAVTVIVLLPVMAAAALQLIRRPEDLDFKAHASNIISSVRMVLLRFMFGMAVLPYEAYRYTDAIIRTNWRMIISGKKLLEWTTSADDSRNTRNNIWSNYREMWIGPLLSIACFSLFLYTNYPAFYVSSPILILWFIAPAIAWRLSIPEKEESSELTKDQVLFLHKTARKTWSFFEKFVNEEDNWLPPDNFQEHPNPVIAHRTSPTNMGLALLANLTAYDFGYIPLGELVNKCNNTLETMLKMERYKGHFYNWYDTKSLLPLPPKYVSTVDSGNLLGHLLTLRQGFLSLSDQLIFNPRSFEGIKTTVEILQDLQKNQKNEKLETIWISVNSAIEEDSPSLNVIKKHLDDFFTLSSELRFSEEENKSELTNWRTKLENQIKNIRDDLSSQIPWLELLPVPDSFSQLILLDYNNSLAFNLSIKNEYLQLIDYFLSQETNTEAENIWLQDMQSFLRQGSRYAAMKIFFIEQLAEQCEQLSIVDYDFLYDKSTSFLRIGFNVDELRRDDSSYDMLASEARLGVFVGIAQGKLPQESWFSLGRLLTNSKGGPILLSWSGSMFEYLMPQIIMPAYKNTLLSQTNIAAVKRQIEYAKKRGTPWGISESGYNSVDANLNYQYQAFGVPGTGLKRGLEEDLVIAPYATMLALMVAPAKACTNLQLLSSEGFEGEFGYFEAIDYTTSRLPRGRDHVVINSYMAHHQGMGFLSLSYVLLNKPMQERFSSELRFQATLLLLQERIPKTSVFYAHTTNINEAHAIGAEVQVRSSNTPNTLMPELKLLSNGNYQVMVTNSGGGYSRWKDLSITRWREDVTKDDYGIFCYIKDVNSGTFWSNTYHPTLKTANSYEAIFCKGHIEFRREDYGIHTKTEIVVSPEDDTEMRRIKITNRTQSTKVLEVTSYAEIVMASQASDESHPAFSNLFVQTEILPEYRAIFSTRRPRSKNELPPYLFHLMDVHGALIEEVSYETDRMQFIGRGRTLAHPQALETSKLLGNQGSVLDPIMAIRYRITINPHQTATIDLILGISETKESTEALMHKYRDRNLKKRAFELSWTHSQVLLRQINATEADAQIFGKLATSVIYTNPKLRANASIIASNSRGQSGLWSHSISGDRPIVLLQIFDPESLGLVSQMIKAHSYWQLKGLAVDLVILNEEHGTYRHLLQDQLLGMVTAGNTLTNHVPGNIFVKSSDQISSEDRILLESVAKIIIKDTNGTLLEQISSHIVEKRLPPSLELTSSSLSIEETSLSLPNDLLFFNGTGGFTADGTEYKILIDKNKTTPAPWSNVISNSILGTVVSESGSAYTWAVNAHEYRITPWSNDPVTDIGGEAFYLRDEETGDFWSPSPYPAKGKTSYITTHGFGYTTYEHIESGISSEMKVFVDKDAPIKFVVLKIKNNSGRSRKFSATGFLEIVLGGVRSKTNMHILSEHDIQSGALLFRNRYNSAFAERVAFFKVSGGHNFSFTADRAEFIGRNRNLVNPKALNQKKLSGRIGAGMDTCAAILVKFDLLDGAEKEITFQIGNESTTHDAKELIKKFTTEDTVKQSLQHVNDYWRETIEAVQVTTPDEALNLLANGWLTYQTIASRLLARSGFYQSGGAYGFRDQIQDVLSLFHTKPQLAREQILLNASRQFIEGDVQHWWHPPEGRGVRTNYSDDLLWLPFAVNRYVNATGDTLILNETVGFLESRLLHEGEDSLYDLPITSNQSADLYEHCVRTIKYSLKFGKHGLPLMGSGDWNDGMDQVGNKGKGESVWLAFFLYDILVGFEKTATTYGDVDFAEICRIEAAKLQVNIEISAWDGKWYKRAWFDDGTPLGSKENDECSIDAISQSWSVLSSAAPVERRNTAMDSLNKYLVKRDMKIIQLLDPPFDKSDLNPGYIKGYVPGVRENGGQYSHAAIWALMAFAKLGDRERAYELFSMIQPINHALDAEGVQIYKVEPYVMPADIYANKTHQGRGGWTWYTGSSGWMYQFIIGSLIGLELQVDQLKFTPCFPLNWSNVTIKYQYKESTYKITVYQLPENAESWWKMGAEEGKGDTIPLVDDGMEHVVEVHISSNTELSST